MNEYYIEWHFLLKSLGFVLLLLIVFNVLNRLIPKFIKNVQKRNDFLLLSIRFLLIYKIIASLVIIGVFVQSNYIIHGGILVIVIALTYPFIQSFLHGVVFQLNNLFTKGTRVIVGDYNGEISKFSYLGIVLSSNEGERFINYRDIDKTGFATINKEDGTSRNTIKIETEMTMEEIQDLLFEMPIVNFNYPPNLSKEGSNTFNLSFTLEDGAKKSSLLNYLAQYNINPTSTN